MKGGREKVATHRENEQNENQVFPEVKVTAKYYSDI